MPRMEELLSDLGEETTKGLAKEYKPIRLEANKKIGGNTAKVARDDIEKKLTLYVFPNVFNWSIIFDIKM